MNKALPALFAAPFLLGIPGLTPAAPAAAQVGPPASPVRPPWVDRIGRGSAAGNGGDYAAWRRHPAQQAVRGVPLSSAPGLESLWPEGPCSAHAIGALADCTNEEIYRRWMLDALERRDAPPPSSGPEGLTLKRLAGPVVEDAPRRGGKQPQKAEAARAKQAGPAPTE